MFEGTLGLLLLVGIGAVSLFTMYTNGQPGQRTVDWFSGKAAERAREEEERKRKGL